MEKPCINRETKSLEITIQLYSCYDEHESTRSCNTTVSLSHLFSLFWIKPETFIIPEVVFLFRISVFSSYLFTSAITLRAYLSAEGRVMVLVTSRRPRPCSICCSSSQTLLVSLGRPYAPSIPVVSTIYDFSFLIS